MTKSYSLISFHCRNCGLIYTISVRDNHEVVFSTESGLHNEKQCLTTNGYFRCISCNQIDNTRKFEKVYY